MSELSVLIDESGDFGPYEHHAPYYIITLVFHDQSSDISEQIEHLRRHLVEQGFAENHAIHSAPPIRRERGYSGMSLTACRKLFRFLVTFMCLCDISHKGASFALQALQFARTGFYPRTKAELANQLDGDEAHILRSGHDWQVCPPSDDGGRKQLIDLLLRWSEGVLAHYIPLPRHESIAICQRQNSESARSRTVPHACLRQ